MSDEEETRDQTQTFFPKHAKSISQKIKFDEKDQKSQFLGFSTFRKLQGDKPNTFRSNSTQKNSELSDQKDQKSSRLFFKDISKNKADSRLQSSYQSSASK